jgi:hypothetical protein
MSVAASRIEQRIIISGTDNASVAIRKAQGALKAFDDQAKKTAAAAAATANAPTEAAAKIQSTTQRAGGALAALTAAMGPAGASLAEAGRSATAFGSAANVLPGPIGLVIAGVAGLGAAAYLLVKQFSEANAKIDQAFGSGQREAIKGVADAIGLSAGAAVKLQQSLADLPNNVLPPTIAELQRVRDNAEAAGLDGEAAVDKYTAALGRGRDALKVFGRENGTFAEGAFSTQRAAAFLGVSSSILEIEKARLTIEQQLVARGEEASEALARHKVATQGIGAALDRQQQAVKEIASLEALRAQDNGENLASYTNQIAAQEKIRETQAAIIQGASRESDAYAETLARLKGVVQELGRQKAAVEAANEARKQGAVLAEDAAVLEAKAGAEKSRHAAYSDRLLAADLRVAATNQKLIALAKERNAIGEELFQKAFKLLQIEDAQEQAARAALKKQQSASAAAARDEAQAKRMGLLDANLRVTKAKSDADAFVSAQERLDLQAQEQAKELVAINASKAGHATKEALRTALAQEGANKRAQIGKDEDDRTTKALEKMQAAQQVIAERSAVIVADASNVAIEGAKSRASSMAARLRESGDDELATLVEIRQAHADHAQALKKIDAELATAKGQEKLTPADVANLDVAAKERRLQALEAFDAREQTLADNDARRSREQIAQGAQIVQLASESLGDSKFTKGATAAAAAVARIAASYKGLAGSAPDAIGAVGGVVAAIIDGEREKATVLAVTEAAASAASYPNIPAMVAHGAASALYAAAALGAVPTAKSNASSSDGGGSSLGQSSGDSGGGGSGGKATVTHIHIYPRNVIGTAHQVAQEVHGVLKNLKGTGYAA